VPTLSLATLLSSFFLFFWCHSIIIWPHAILLSRNVPTDTSLFLPSAVFHLFLCVPFRVFCFVFPASCFLYYLFQFLTVLDPVHVTTTKANRGVNKEMSVFLEDIPLCSKIENNKCICFSGLGSSVGIATGYGLDGPGIESRCGGDIYRACSARPWGPPSLLYNGYRVFPGG